MPRTLTTGDHVIREISCCFCSKKIGWKYVHRSLHHIVFIMIDLHDGALASLQGWSLYSGASSCSGGRQRICRV